MYSENFRSFKTDADSALSKKGVVLLWHGQVGEGFVPAHIKCTDNKRTAIKSGQHIAIHLKLFIFRWGCHAFQKQKFGTQQAHPFGTKLDCLLCILNTSNIGHNFHAFAIGAYCGIKSCCKILIALLLQGSLFLHRLIDKRRRWIDPEGPFRTIQDKRSVILDIKNPCFHSCNGWNIQ